MREPNDNGAPGATPVFNVRTKDGLARPPFASSLAANRSPARQDCENPRPCEDQIEESERWDGMS